MACWHRYFIFAGMIIEVVIFFIWVLIVLIVGALLTLPKNRRRRMQGKDNVSTHLSFPQRNWLPLCLIIAVVSPLVVAGFNALTSKRAEKIPVERNGAAYLGGDTTVRDTSYHVAAPPQH